MVDNTLNFNGALTGVDRNDHPTRFPGTKDRGDCRGAIFGEHQHPIIGLHTCLAKHFCDVVAGSVELVKGPVCANAVA